MNTNKKQSTQQSSTRTTERSARVLLNQEKKANKIQ